ncbi:uncharacterized protein [Vulpes vulpes]|uniref:Uncharacterized protein n=1 Tax=Vulpes vulpes TaxID=9627 RepID=A0ABM4Y8R5_VULVU
MAPPPPPPPPPPWCPPAPAPAPGAPPRAQPPRGAAAASQERRGDGAQPARLAAARGARGDKGARTRNSLDNGVVPRPFLIHFLRTFIIACWAPADSTPGTGLRSDKWSQARPRPLEPPRSAALCERAEEGAPHHLLSAPLSLRQANQQANVYSIHKELNLGKIVEKPCPRPQLLSETQGEDSRILPLYPELRPFYVVHTLSSVIRMLGTPVKPVKR